MIPSVTFAVSFHPQVMQTSRPREAIRFVGQSLLYYNQVRAAIADVAMAYAALPLRRVDLELYAAVHDQAYLTAIQQAAEGASAAPALPVNAECAGLEYALPGYTYSLGRLCAAIDLMRQGNLERAYCFSLGGHHAFPDRGHGYCLLNPLAAAARYAQRAGFSRILILDWDIHHGDGTQAIFANDPSVYCISVHSALDLYMAKASSLALGTTTTAAAAGHCNIPIVDRRFGDEAVSALGLSGRFYRGQESLSALAEALATMPWSPDLIAIFSGYDGHRDDCGRHVTNWDDNDFRQLTCLALDHAHRVGCPVLSVHGGGYKLPVTVAAASTHIDTLATYRSPG